MESSKAKPRYSSTSMQAILSPDHIKSTLHFTNYDNGSQMVQRDAADLYNLCIGDLLQFVNPRCSIAPVPTSYSPS